MFISRYIENIADKDAYLAMVRAYNTFLAEDYCSVAPDRLIGNAVIPITGTEDAVTEMKRVKSLGLRSLCLSQFPAGEPTPSPDDDVFWHAALEAGMAITAHGSLGGAGRMNPLHGRLRDRPVRHGDGAHVAGDPRAHRGDRESRRLRDVRSDPGAADLPRGDATRAGCPACST